MPKLLATALSLLLLVAAGCLEFDAQEITMRYDAAADRVDLLVVYRGLFVETSSDSAEEACATAFEDMAKVLDRGQCFLWCNWPFAIDPTLTDTKLAPLAQHLEVENGKLFTDPEGRLHGYQFVRIVRAEEFLKKVNLLLGVALQAAVTGGADDLKFDADSRENLIEFMRSGGEFLHLEAGRIELRLPFSPADFTKALGKVEEHLLRNEAPNMIRRAVLDRLRASGEQPTATKIAREEFVVEMDVERLRTTLREAAGLRFFWDNEFTIDRGQELQRIGIGAKGNAELELVKASDGLYSDNFLAALRERGDEIEEGVPDQELARRFAEFRSRDAVLPEGLKAARAK